MKNIYTYVFVILLVTNSFLSYGQGNTFPTNGNVGIGTTSPQVKLHVNHAGNGQTAIFAIGGDPNFRLVSRQDQSLNSDGSILTELGLEYGTARNTGIRFHRGFSATGGFMSFSTDTGVERMRITTNGNVGIGSTSPIHKLDVNGTIRTKEVNVTNSGWADFVFDPEYELIPLIDLSRYIEENGHLPSIPTEEEVEENGFNIAEMNVKLLQKIEELTLYLIQQNDRIIELENKILDKKN